MTTSDLIAIGFGVAGLIIAIATLTLHMHGMPKEKVRVAWILVAVALTAAASTLGYATVSKASARTTSPAQETSVLVGSWSGSYTIEGVKAGLSMRITSPGGNRLTAAITVSVSSAGIGGLSGTYVMHGTCSRSQVRLASSDADLRGTPPATADSTFTGTMDLEMSLTFSVTKS